MIDLQSKKTPDSRLPRFGIGLVAALILAAHLPFFFVSGRDLWLYRPQFWFFPFMLLAVAVLLWRRWPQSANAAAGFWRYIANTSLTIGLVALASSVVLHAPWLAAIAAVVTTGGLLLRFGGAAMVARLFPIALLLWFVIYSPMLMEGEWLSWLQTTTFTTSSMLLDLLDIRHLQSDSQLHFPDRESLTIEAINGDQFVLIACCAVFTVVVRRRWLYTASLLASTVCWATAINISRVTIVAVAAAQFDLDIAAGWQHEVLSYALVVFGLLMIMFTDQFLFTLFAPVIDPEGKPYPHPLSRLWNWSVATPIETYSMDVYGNDFAHQEFFGNDDEDRRGSRRPENTESNPASDENAQEENPTLKEELVRVVQEADGRLAMTVGALRTFLLFIAGLCLFAWFFLFGFAFIWFHSRPFRPLLRGLPAALVAGAMLTVIGLARHNTNNHVPDEYLNAAIEASHDENSGAADLYLKKLASLNAPAAEVQYSLAIAAEQQGDMSRARELLRNIAPADRQGDSRAHLWLARDLARDLDAATEAPKEATLQLLEHHLTNAIDRPSSDAEARLMLGQLYLRQNKLDAATEQYALASTEQPDVLLVLARLYSAAGERLLAKTTAARAAAHYKQQSQSEPANVDFRLKWAQSELFLTNHEQAASVLADGLTQLQNQDETETGRAAALRQPLAIVYLSWFDRVRQKDADNVGLQMDLLQKALEFDPNHPEVLNRLAMFALLDHEQAAAAHAVLTRMLTRGDAPATVHFILGSHALLHESPEKSMQHLSLAFEQMPQIPFVANNLAWAMAHKDPPDLVRAEKLVDAAIQLTPKHP